MSIQLPDLHPIAAVIEQEVIAAQERSHYRLISHSEATTLLECQAQHDFRYVGQLAGTALKPKTATPLMRQGKAWGAAAAALHAYSSSIDSFAAGEAALLGALDEDATEQMQAGAYSPEEHDEMRDRLMAMLEHYFRMTEPLSLKRPEHEFLVPIPSRMGRRRSNRYRLQCFIDGIHTDADGRDWIVEFKLRKQLSSYEQIVLSRQTRWYAWAWRETTGREVTGIIVDERLNALPSPVKLNKDGSLSKVQSCTAEDYLAAAQEVGQEPNVDVLDQLASKAWQTRHSLLLRPDELEETGAQLVSVAQQIHAMDTGEFYPVRNPSRARCPSCAFRDICPNPGDLELVDALYDRVPAKQDRQEAA